MKNETLLGRALCIEPDFIKKPKVEEDDQLSDDEISDEFVPVEDGDETNTVEVSEPNNDNETTKQIQLLRLRNGTMTTE